MLTNKLIKNNTKTLKSIEIALNRAVLEPNIFAIDKIEGLKLTERIILYDCVKMGLISKISTAKYKINFSKNEIPNLIEPILMSYRSKQKVRISSWRKSNKEEKVFTHLIPNENNYNSILNELDCIKYLKGLGYKIMKPIQQFEEI